MSLANPWALHQGPEWYTMLLYLLSYKLLVCKMCEYIQTYYKDIKSLKTARMQEETPQTVHKKMKDKLIQLIRQYTKCLFSRIDKNIATLKNDKQKALNHLK